MKPIGYLYIGLVLLALVPWFIGGRYILHIATMTTIMAPMALSMGLMLKLGQLSIAQPAFMGIGAYTAALLATHLGIPPWLSLLIGGLAAAAMAVLTGPVFLRVKGVYFVLLTYAFGQIVFLIFQEWTSVTGGMSGLYGLRKLNLFGFRMARPEHFYALGLIFTAACYLGLRAIEKSDIGAIIDSINEDEMLCRATGSDALSWRVAAYTLSGFIAGLSGGIYAFYIGFLSPDPFGFRGSVDLIVMNTVGGAGSILGPLLGSILVVPMPELLREAREYQLLIYGVFLILFLVFLRKGLVSLGDMYWKGKK